MFLSLCLRNYHWIACISHLASSFIFLSHGILHLVFKKIPDFMDIRVMINDFFIYQFVFHHLKWQSLSSWPMLLPGEAYVSCLLHLVYQKTTLLHTTCRSCGGCWGWLITLCSLPLSYAPHPHWAQSPTSSPQFHSVGSLAPCSAGGRMIADFRPL